MKPVTRLVELDPLTPSNHCLLGLSWSLGGDAAAALPAHRRAVELDAKSTICRLRAGVALTLAGQPEEAAERFDWLERQPEEDHLARVGMRFRRGLRGDRAAVLAPMGGAERAMAESDEYWSYLMASAYALVGDEEQASTDSATCEALRASSSRWPRNSSEAFTAFGLVPAVGRG